MFYRTPKGEKSLLNVKKIIVVNCELILYQILYYLILLTGKLRIFATLLISRSSIKPFIVALTTL